jgi:hypothetical protein
VSTSRDGSQLTVEWIAEELRAMVCPERRVLM